MKFLKILNEENLLPIEKRIIGRMLKSELDPEDFGDNFDVLKNKWLITDFNLILKLVHVYQAVFSDIEDGDLSILDTKDFSNFENILDDYDDKVIALALYLNVSPSNIEENKYRYYGLSNYTVDGDEYAIGTEDEANNANDEYVENIISDFYSFYDDTTLVNYLIVNENEIKYFAKEMADSRVDDMSDDDILEEAGYSTDDIEEKEELESNLEELQDEITDLESDLEDTNNEISSVTEDLENPENEDDIEYFKNELENYQKQKTEITISINEKISQIEGINNRIEELGDLSDLVERAKDELRERFTDEYVDEMDSPQWFINNLGYKAKDLINSSCFEIDEDAIRSDFSDRGDNLASYDGNERDVSYKDTYYVIYRVN
jgi:hypothetical protein